VTPEVSTGFLETDGERLYWESTGRGRPVVLSHGLGGNHASWFQQVVAFAAERRVVTWDQRGFGRSSRRGATGPAAAAADLRALLDHLEIERAHLVGQSMGGWTVLGLALAHPGRVRSVVLADTIGGIYTPEVERHFDEYIRRAAAELPAYAVSLTRHPALGAALGDRDPARAFLYREIASLAEPPPLEIPRLLRTTAHPLEAVAALEVPVLCVVGLEDPIFPPAVIREVAARLRRARVVEIPGCGHSPYFEDPESWNRAVRTFWEEAEAGAIPPA
jgi:3-oxoadipate enol-lactonase